MNITIVGDGKVGYTLARRLSEDGHDITIIDKNAEALARAGETLDVMCVRGNGANVRTLMESGIENADVVIAVTGNDELNMVCCLAAKQLGAKYSIARIRDPEYTESLTLLQNRLDIDQVINPERATAQGDLAPAALPLRDQHRVVRARARGDGRIPRREHRPDHRRAAVQAQRPLSAHPVYRRAARGRGVHPRRQLEIAAGDRVYATGDRESITKFFKQMGKDTSRMKAALMIGGGHISIIWRAASPAWACGCG